MSLLERSLSDYNENLSRASNEMHEFINIVKDKIRPYLGQKEAYNLPSQFETFNPKKISVISKEDLIEISKNPDFQQLLFEANFKLKSNINRINNLLLTQNNNLRNLIIKELKSY